MGRDDLSMRVAITNAEPVYDYQRTTIAAAFRCDVRETYGMAEIVAAASECGARRLHLWPEVGWLEIVNGTSSTKDNAVGDLVCTGLLNADMPLIRYRVGDKGTLGGAAPCSCGRTLPALASIEGRADDLLYTADGREVGRLDPIFKARLPVREAQIIQETVTRIRLRYSSHSRIQSVCGSIARAKIARSSGPSRSVFRSSRRGASREKRQVPDCDLPSVKRRERAFAERPTAFRMILVLWTAPLY